MSQMNQTNLHPSVRQFKVFVRNHPGLVTEVKDGKRTLQDIYEEWSILGEEHEQWQPFLYDGEIQSGQQVNDQQEVQEEQTSTNAAESTTSSDATEEESAAGTGEFLGQLMGLVKKMNVQDLQSHLTQFSSVLGNVQNLMQTFQRPQEPTRSSESESPFSFRRD